jgi:hypothetical protein
LKLATPANGIKAGKEKEPALIQSSYDQDAHTDHKVLDIAVLQFGVYILRVHNRLYICRIRS